MKILGKFEENSRSNIFFLDNQIQKRIFFLPPPATPPTLIKGTVFRSSGKLTSSIIFSPNTVAHFSNPEYNFLRLQKLELIFKIIYRRILSIWSESEFCGIDKISWNSPFQSRELGITEMPSFNFLPQGRVDNSFWGDFLGNFHRIFSPPCVTALGIFFL
jgi:hypothetical protein